MTSALGDQRQAFLASLRQCHVAASRIVQGRFQGESGGWQGRPSPGMAKPVQIVEKTGGGGFGWLAGWQLAMREELLESGINQSIRRHSPFFFFFFWNPLPFPGRPPRTDSSSNPFDVR